MYSKTGVTITIGEDDEYPEKSFVHLLVELSNGSAGSVSTGSMNVYAVSLNDGRRIVPLVGDGKVENVTFVQIDVNANIVGSYLTGFGPESNMGKTVACNFPYIYALTTTAGMLLVFACTTTTLLTVASVDADQCRVHDIRLIPPQLSELLPSESRVHNCSVAVSFSTTDASDVLEYRLLVMSAHVPGKSPSS